MFPLLIFLVGFHIVICHMPMEFRKYIESTLIIHKEDYPLFKEPLKSSIKRVFLKEPLRKSVKINAKVAPTNNDMHIYVDEIIHYLISSSHPNYSNVSAFEADFLNLLGMKGFKYVYKRGTLWKTWREVVDVTLKKKILTYRAENNDNRTCAECHNVGYWAIEEKPELCPYEIFSMKDASNVCVKEITHFAESTQCTDYSQTEALKDICNNPIVTQWRFTRAYDIPERNVPKSSVICQGREKCEITTIYQFEPHQIIFRIVNAESLILYSRIMRKNEKNYACVINCGYIQMDTMTVQNGPIVRKLQFNKIIKPSQPRNEYTDEDTVQRDKDVNFETTTYNILNGETPIELQFEDKQPIINWNTHEFKFDNTVNSKYATPTNQTSETVVNRDIGVPIARSGRRLNINDDIDNNLLEDITKVESTTKLQCKNIIKDEDYYDDNRDYNYYIDDEEKEKNIDQVKTFCPQH